MKPGLWQRIRAWWAGFALIFDYPSECRICGRKGKESEIRRHVVLEHYEAYKHALRHGRLP